MKPDCYMDLPLRLISLYNLYKEVDGLLRGFLLLRKLTGMPKRAESLINTGLLQNYQGRKHVGIRVNILSLRVKTCS